MVSGKVTVKNPTGLHLRPAGTLCKQAMQFKSSITFHYGDGNTANAKSVLSVLAHASNAETKLSCSARERTRRKLCSSLSIPSGRDLGKNCKEKEQ